MRRCDLTSNTAIRAQSLNDVGADAWEEINKVAKGANYGWNIYEGPESDAHYVDPIFAYGHDGDAATTGYSITGSAFYNPETLQFPSEEYAGDYFFADFCSGWIRRREPPPPPSPGEAGGSHTASDFASGIEHPVDLEASKEGELYYLSRSNSITPGSVGKIRYSGDTA